MNKENTNIEIQYNININQFAYNKHFQNYDLIDATIIGYIKNLCMSANSKLQRKLIENRIYTRFHLGTLLTKNPLLKNIMSSKSSICKRLPKYRTDNLILSHQEQDNTLYVCLGENMDLLEFSKENNVGITSIPVSPEKHPVSPEKHPVSPEKQHNNIDNTLDINNKKNKYKKENFLVELQEKILPEYNKVMNTKLKNGKGIVDNYAYWRNDFTVEEIIQAIRNIKFDKFWYEKARIKIDTFFRKNQNHIENFLNLKPTSGENNPPTPLSENDTNENEGKKQASFMELINFTNFVALEEITKEEKIEKIKSWGEKYWLSDLDKRQYNIEKAISEI